MLKWFHGLRVSQKLMLIGFFFMIPDSIMLYLFITEINANIAVARLEQVGNRYQRPLERLLDLVPRHRLLAREALGGDAEAQGQLAKVAADIDAAFDVLEATDAQIGGDLEFTPEGLAKRNRQGCDARSVRRVWDRLSGQMDGITPAGRDACERNHLKLIADLRTMVSQAGDVSNLILDPDIDSYYLMDVTLLALPVTQDRLAQVAADGADLIRGGGTDANLRIKVAVGLAQLRDDGLARVQASSEVSLNDNKQGGEMGGVCASLQSELPPALADYVAAAKRFDDLTERVASSPAGGGGVSVADYLAAGTAARDASYAYWQVAVDQVNAILQNRIDYYTWRRTRSLGVAGCALMMAVALVTFITRSITNPLRRRAEEAVAEGEARCARITANVPGMVYQFLLRPDGTSTFPFVGEGVRDLLGLEPDQLRADPGAFMGLIEAHDLATLREREAESAATLRPWRWEGRVRHAKTGAQRWVAGNSRPERQADGSTLWDGVMTDVTAIKVAEAAAEAAAAAAEAANAAKSDFLANMSHEIRTPLNGVVGMVDLLQATALSGQQGRYTQVIRSSSDTLLSLINDILDFSKIEAGKMELDEVDFDLNETVEEVATLLAQKAAAKGLEVACDVEPAVPTRLRGDADRLRQVLTNLVNNAIKFTASGEVVVRVSPAAEPPVGDGIVIRFAVSDTGIGIPPDRLDRLFKSFSQVDASTTRRFGGTGLGLAISKQLVELMGGRIGVQSEAGKGSTFWFTAVLRRPATAAPEVPAPAGPHSLSDRRLLVADANPTQRRILQNQLMAWGARVSTAATGEAAVELLRTEAAGGRPFAAAVVDADLPDLTGAALASAVRAVEALRPLPLILTCGPRATVDPADAARHGFTAGLPKPVRQSHLFDAVMAAVVVTPPAQAALPVVATPVVPEVRTTAGARILLVDDMEVNQFIAGEILARSGYSCDLANNGREAVEAVARRSYELVLMDCQMPEMSGFEAAAAIRAREQQAGADGGRVPIIALTANALKGDRERCVAAGMDDYLTKPLNPAQLIQTIAARIGPGTPPAAGEAARAA
jgi:signal transduction histidine kinase/DNA-binding response OmpR family regulator